MVIEENNQGNSINDVVFISLTELGQQLENERRDREKSRDRRESRSQKIFWKTPKGDSVNQASTVFPRPGRPLLLTSLNPRIWMDR